MNIRKFKVATFYDSDRPARPCTSRVRTYTRDYNEEWPDCIVYECIAASSADARRQAAKKRVNHELFRPRRKASANADKT